MIIDSHHHLWHFNTEEYGWMDGSMAVLKKDYLPGDIKGELEKAGVEGTVVVQARQSIEETSWLLEQAENNSFIRGVVGWVDLRSRKLEEQLAEFSGHSKLVGVRHVIHDESDDDFMLGNDFLRGIETLGLYDLSYDLLLFPRHLSRAAKLASMFPGQRFVLDHISKPLIRQSIMEPWNRDILTLAEQPNVYCKISGMVTEADRKNWKYEDFIPYLDVVLDAFGHSRLMLGSDWPVCLLSAAYGEVLQIPLRYFEGFDSKAREKIFRKNCIDFYKLNDM